jgi:hypothetical protein
MATNIQATFGAGAGLTAGDFQLGFRRVGRDSGVPSPSTPLHDQASPRR